MRAGIDLSVSTLADHVGSSTAALDLLHRLIEAHVFAGERVHGDDTTVPLLAMEIRRGLKASLTFTPQMLMLRCNVATASMFSRNR